MSLISKTGIVNGQTIQAEHVTRIIDALNESGSSAVIATGSFTGSFAGDGSQLTGLSVATSSYALNSNLLDGYDSSYFATTGSNTFNGTQIINGDVTITGTASIAVLHVTYESASVIYSSGSNQLGDATSDIQTLIGTVIVSGSLNVTGSANLPNITGSLLGTSSFAVSASVAQNAISASYAPNSDTASFASTASFITSSNVYGPYGANSIASASYAISASYVIGGINPFPYTGSAEITGSLGVTGSVNVTRLGIGAIGSTSIPLDVRAQGALITDVAFRVRNSGNTDNIISIAGDGTTIVNGSVSAPAFTGSLFGTASWANNSITASYSNVSVSSSFATTALSASYAPGITTIAQTDVIYVDSVNGADNSDTNRGNIEKPYATVEYVLANTNNSGSVTGDTTNGSATITNVSDTTDIKVGQYITGTNIPYNSVVISKTSSTIVLSQTATGTGTSLTLTWWTPKLLRLSGDFIATSNWWRQGFYFDSNPTVTIQWGAFTLFNINVVGVIPYINNGEFSYYGTTSTSKWLYNASNTTTNDTNYVFKFNTIHTDTTSYTITLGAGAVYNYGKYIISGNVLNAKFGYAFGIGWSFQNIFVDIDYTYGLLGGVSYQFFQGLGHWNGSITTPASVYAINGSGGAGAMQFNDGKINGSVYFDGQSAGGGMRIPFFSDIVSGTTCNIRNTVMYGKVSSNCILNGNVDLYGHHTSYIYVDTGYNRIFQQPQWGVITRNSATAEVCANMGLYSITTQNTSKCIINATVSAGGSSIASGSKLIVNGELSVPNLTINGELVNNNTTTITTTTATISSTGILRNYKNLQSTSTSTGSALITKDGGSLYLYPGSYLKVANARGPLNCTANTTGSKNIYNFSSITNGNGSTYGLLIPFSGSSFAAIDLVGGVLYENINY